MQSIKSQSSMLNRSNHDAIGTCPLSNIVFRWDGAIRRELRRLARYLWPDARLLGLIPIHNFRLRKQVESGTIVWWIEHDIPPSDHYRCEAYRVELSLAWPDQPQLVVCSGISAYSVIPVSMENLKTALIQAGADAPLIIRRQFGPAMDP